MPSVLPRHPYITTTQSSSARSPENARHPSTMDLPTWDHQSTCAFGRSTSGEGTRRRRSFMQQSAILFVLISTCHRRLLQPKSTSPPDTISLARRESWIRAKLATWMLLMATEVKNHSTLCVQMELTFRQRSPNHYLRHRGRTATQEAAKPVTVTKIWVHNSYGQFNLYSDRKDSARCE